MKIPFSEISPEGRRVELTDASWFPDGETRSLQPVHGHVSMARKDSGKVLVEGKARIMLELRCDCCLESFSWPLDLGFSLMFIHGDDPNWHLHDLEIPEGDLDTTYVDRPVLDLDEVLQEQVLLSLPDKRLCRPDCLGLCPDCGADLNKAECGCDPSTRRGDSPFATLARLGGKKH